ncbi:LamG-like jellyroll fold domain-containing protein [Pontibacter korlensis]|uniref:LamG-like jellyroll fold domain-containing protein n=1 Tax=Pontibacter korlensis TaxID=400092 RepID=UPI0008FFDB9A|nr:LamG-like jellyroll fold domain-containing protein [Pontibacter korlensis]
MEHKFYSFSTCRAALRILALLLACCFTYQLQAQQLAFPTAEGFGRFATGGRGGEVYHVTNLNDSGPGSFRDAVSKPNRTVVFDVGGVIRISSRIIVSPNITIAGQTAPGDGITVYGNGLSYSEANNTITRHIRFRMGKVGDSGKDAIAIASGHDMIFDHVSITWGRDGTFDINGDVRNVTLQNSIVGQGLQTHSTGGLVQSTGGVSILRCLYIDNHTRNPKVKGMNQFVNNVVYDWAVAGYILGDSQGRSEANVQNNYFIDGPETGDTPPFNRANENFHLFAENNWHDANENGVLDGSVVPAEVYGPVTWMAEPFDFPQVTMHSPQQAYEWVVANVGASLHRDEVDAFLIDELTSLGTKGQTISDEMSLPTAGPGKVRGGAAAPDTDQDGIPDYWEVQHNLDPNNAEDGKVIGSSGYSNLELYLEDLIVNGPGEFMPSPFSLRIAGVSPTTVELVWEVEEGSTAQTVLERSENGGAYTVVATLPASTLAFTDTNLKPETEYTYRLQSLSGSEASGYTSPVLVSTPPIPTAPAAPAGAAPADAALYNGMDHLMLRWTGSESTDSYHVYFGTDATKLAHQADGTENSFHITELKSNTTYFWRVDASNEIGRTEGQVWTFTTGELVRSGKVGDWKMDEGSGIFVTDYSQFANSGELRNSEAHAWVAGMEKNALDLNTSTTTTHVHVPHQEQLYFDENSFAVSFWMKTSMQSGHAYLFHKGTFSRSAFEGATGQWFGLELKDRLLRFAVDDDRKKSEVGITITELLNDEWVHVVTVRDAENKKIRIYLNGMLAKEANDNTSRGIGQTEPLIIGNSRDFNVAFKGALDEFKVYNYALSPQEIALLYQNSPLISQATSPTPADLATAVEPDMVELGWQGDAPAYNLYLGTAADALELKAAGLTQSAYVLENLSHGTGYFWRVDAVDGGDVVEGDVWRFTTAATSDLEEQTKEGMFYAYPNPFSDQLHVELQLKKRDQVSIAIYDQVNGQRLHTLVSGTLEAGLHRLQWNATDARFASLKPGVYFCVLQTSTYKMVRRIVKQ